MHFIFEGGLFLYEGGWGLELGNNYVCVELAGVVADVALSVKAREESQFAVVGPRPRWVKATRLLRFKVGAGC